MGLKLVYEPLKIRGCVIPNRVSRSAHATALSHYGAITGRYQLGPGVNVEASVFHFNVNGNFTGSGGVDKNSATGVMTGLLLNF